MTPATVRSIELGITNKCTLRCPHCDSITMGMPNKPATNLDTAVLISFLDELPALETVLIEGAYSDQLMYPNLLDVVRYCKNRQLKIRFCTHGSARSNDWWVQLGQLLDSNDIIRFAIDGSTQTIHEQYRVGSNLAKVLANHATIKQHSGVITSLQHIMFEYNKYDTDNVLQLATSEGFDRCEMIHCGNVTITPELKQRGIVPIDPLSKQYALNNKIVNSFKTLGTVHCDSIARSEIYINHRGEVTMCADHDDGVVKPNITNSTLQDVFKHLNEQTDKHKCFKFCNQLEYNIGKTFPTIIHGNGEQVVNFHTRELS